MSGSRRFAIAAKRLGRRYNMEKVVRNYTALYERLTGASSDSKTRVDSQVETYDRDVSMSLSDYKKIILHCGIHKTGSSYIQNILSERTNVLREWGFNYPCTDRHKGNHSIIAMNYKEGEDINSLFMRFVNIDSECPILLLSGEEFPRHLPRGKFLEEFLQAASGADVQFIFYLRRPDHLLESVYAESVKNQLYGDINDTKFQFNFYETVRPFVEAVGKENVIIRPYNRELWSSGQLGADFCAALGEPDLWEAIVPTSEVFVNSSLTRNQTFLLSRLEDRVTKQRLLRYFNKNPMPSPDDDVKFFMSPQERRRFNLLHAATSQRLADVFGLGDVKEFLGIDDYEEDPNWRPYVPNWEQLFYCMSEFASEELEGENLTTRKAQSN